MKHETGEDSRKGSAVDDPAVSVLIPVFNREEYVAEAISSVAGQTFDDWELIVIDDGSTDGSLRVIRETIAEARIPLERVRLVSRENWGVVPTTIEGFSLARGRFLALLDSDDAWEPDRLEVQIRAIDALGPEWGACFSDAWVVDETGAVRGRLGSIHPYRGGDILRDLVLSRFVPPSPTALFRVDAIRAVGGFDPTSFFQDLPMWLRIARRYRICFVDRPLARYRAHGGSLGRSNVEAVFDATWEQIDRLTREPDLARYRRRALARVRSRFAVAFFNEMSLVRARTEALKALALFPLDVVAWRVLAGSLLGERVVRKVRAARQKARERRGFR